MFNGPDGRVSVTGQGEPVAVIIAVAGLDVIVETLDVLSTPGALEAIREVEGDAVAGRYATMDHRRAAVRE